MTPLLRPLSSQCRALTSASSNCRLVRTSGAAGSMAGLPLDPQHAAGSPAPGSPAPGSSAPGSPAPSRALLLSAPCPDSMPVERDKATCLPGGETAQGEHFFLRVLGNEALTKVIQLGVGERGFGQRLWRGPWGGEGCNDPGSLGKRGSACVQTFPALGSRTWALPSVFEPKGGGAST